MVLNHDLLGVESAPEERSWGCDDVMIYALGVGAGHGDPSQELMFTTENSRSAALTVLPTFANMLMRGNILPLGDFDPGRLVHGEHRFEVFGALPVEGRSSSTSEIVAIHDKGHAAVMLRKYRIRDAITQDLIATATQTLFIKGEGGFGGDSGPKPSWTMPEGEPSHVVEYQTRPEQALLYRLTGDHNPLHSDPEFARDAGFDRPILHGMCTYGYAGRAILHAACGGDPSRFRSMEARFSSPVHPGDRFRVAIWDRDGEGYFRVHVGDRVVLDRGRFTYS